MTAEPVAQPRHDSELPGRRRCAETDRQRVRKAEIDKISSAVQERDAEST